MSQLDDSENAELREKIQNIVNKKYSELSERYREQLIQDGLNFCSNNAFVSDDELENYLFHKVSSHSLKLVLKKIEHGIKDAKPQLNKYRTRQIMVAVIADAMKPVIKNRRQSIRIARLLYCSPSQAPVKPASKWLYHTVTRKDSSKYIEHITDDGIHEYQQHVHHIHLAEYIAIPVLIYTISEPISMGIALAFGAFFRGIGTAVMLYLHHFITVGAIPRFVLSVIGDGIMYGINRKRDEE